MHVEAALRAIEDEVLELALEVGLHLEELGRRRDSAGSPGPACV
jgi:hypothetical protein